MYSVFCVQIDVRRSGRRNHTMSEVLSKKGSDGISSDEVVMGILLE